MIPNFSVSQFEQITNYPLGDFLIEYRDFISGGRNDVVSYYSGGTSIANQSSFEKLNQLLIKSESIQTVINNHKTSFNNACFWELVDTLTDIDGTLLTIDNSSKWMRSVIGKNDFSSIIEREDYLRQQETLERMSTRFGSTDPNNDWASIALRNDLIEEDYTSDGGNVLKISISRVRSTGSVITVVDTLQGKSIYGIDLERIIRFNEELSDLAALSYENTVVQSVEILTALKQGDTPEFPLDGIQVSLVAGSNRNSVAYPILFRQFYSTFKTDDTLSNLTITNIINQQDALSVQLTINTVLGQSLIQQSLL